MKRDIIMSLPIVSNVHGGSCLFGSICGLKAAVETSTNGASVHSLLWAAGYSAAAFCIAMALIKQNELTPDQKKKATFAVLILMIAIPIVIFSISDNGGSSEPANHSSGQSISYICSKNERDYSISYYLVNSVLVIDTTIILPNTITDITIEMSRFPSKSGWDTNALCDPKKIDLPESDWRILSIGSDCGVGTAITACDIDTIKNDQGITGLHIFPLKNGYYSSTSGKVERGTLIKVSGKASR
jgi:hypothetical protein